MREGGTRGSRRSVIVRSGRIGPSRKAPCSPLHVNPHLVRAPLQDRDARERSRVDVSRPTLRRSTFPFSHRPPSQSSAPRPRTRARVYTSLPMAAGKGSSPFLSPPPLGRFLSTGSSSGGESFSSDAYLGRPASPSLPSAAGPSRAAIVGVVLVSLGPAVDICERRRERGDRQQRGLLRLARSGASGSP